MSATPIKTALKSQYHAALLTLQQTVENCPEDLWTDSTNFTNPYWHLSYHTLFFAHMYMMQNLAAFKPWEGHRSGMQDLAKADIDKIYTKDEILAYCQWCISRIDQAVDTLDLDHPESGFSWYEVPKLEHQIVGIRHIQHHTAQLADRLRNVAGVGTAWVKNR